ncbi:MarR family transcriptional regulator [Streptomyces sp. NPDC000410]|uniref:MarR family winged helix-turn-helix transcriptional regulator n=1 Tax=Streptomyces sp. NPDC000410 TaxID=3154254 RepID=UPI00332A6346
MVPQVHLPGEEAEVDFADVWVRLAGEVVKCHLFKMSHFEYQVLATLSEAAEHTMRMSDLATLTNGSLSRLSHVAKRLERQGWVRRTPDPDNGRYTLAILTEAGREKIVATAPGHVEEVRRLVFDPLTQAQQRTLRAIGHRVNQAVDPTDTCRPD